jgi:hypothetical protein
MGGEATNNVFFFFNFEDTDNWFFKKMNFRSKRLLSIIN